LVRNVIIKLDSLGIQRLLNSDDIRAELANVGGQLATKAGPQYVVEQWYERKVAVVNVVDPEQGAIGREAASGNLARAVQGMIK
jgi:hypothetical protein